jgi:hypothetical protein
LFREFHHISLNLNLNIDIQWVISTCSAVISQISTFKPDFQWVLLNDFLNEGLPTTSSENVVVVVSQEISDHQTHNERMYQSRLSISETKT